jgi:hypothetical protein
MGGGTAGVVSVFVEIGHWSFLDSHVTMHYVWCRFCRCQVRRLQDDVRTTKLELVAKTKQQVWALFRFLSWRL